MSELVLFNGDTPVLRLPMHGQSLSVGRSTANDVAIPDDTLAPFLCSFEPVKGGGYRVVDRAGKGLRMDGRLVEDEPVHDGARLVFGALTAVFQQGKQDTTPRPRGGEQRTGILRTRADGKLTRTDIRLRLPASAGGGLREIPASGLRVGALPDNDIVIDDGFVSSFHAQIFLRGERLFVRDLDSTNGTFVGDVRVVEAEVPIGARLRLGKTELGVETSEEVVPVASGELGAGPWTCGQLHTADADFARTFTFIEKVAAHDATACIFGPTGSGKELVAAALHNLSGRRQGPFVSLNCAAFPADLIETELFGHEKGAFTGADRTRKGAFEEADKGTLFLDEIGELPLEMQAKLLRVLETRTVRRLGGRGLTPVDVRVVCATHRDLVEHVRQGKFREDLLHRIYVIPIQLPGLRERPADVTHLARHFARALSPSGKEIPLAPAAEQKLVQHPFPGNVRELRNVIQRALIMGDGKQIKASDLVFIPVTLAEEAGRGSLYKRGMTLEDVEKIAIREALAAYGSMGEAAKALGIPKTTFWRKATAYGIATRDDKAEP